MPILRISKRRGDSAQYDAAIEKLDLNRRHPLGLIMHGAVQMDGAMQIAQVWDSEEYARRFEEEELQPALEAVGAALDAEVTVFELHHLVTP
jgi:hypothetical protein